MALESILRELRPQVDTLDRSVLMYRAGRASTRRGIWPLATLFSTLAALFLGIALWTRPSPSILYTVTAPTRNDSVHASPTASPSVEEVERGAWSRYVHLQEQVLLHGLDCFPASSKAADEPAADLESLLNSL